MPYIWFMFMDRMELRGTVVLLPHFSGIYIGHDYDIPIN